MHDVDYEGNTPLLLAVEGGSADITHHLLEHGSDVNHYNDSRVYPLHTACTIGSLEIVKILVAVRSYVRIKYISCQVLNFDRKILTID